MNPPPPPPPGGQCLPVTLPSGSGSGMLITGFGQQDMQAGTGLDRNNQRANGTTSNVLAIQKPAINYNMSGNDTNVPTARRCQNSGMNFNLRNNSYRSIYDVNGHANYPSNQIAFQYGNSQYLNGMMPMDNSPFGSQNNNTQAYGHSTFPFERNMTTCMMSVMGNSSGGMNTRGLAGNNHYNNITPFRLQSSQHAPFASGEQNHALYHGNVQAGLVPGSAARLISKRTNNNQYTSSVSGPRQLNKEHGYDMSDVAMAKVPNVQSINGHLDASTFRAQHTVRYYGDEMAVNFYNSMATAQHIVRNHGHYMPVNGHRDATSQHLTGANQAHKLFNVPSDIAAIQCSMHYDQGHMPATHYNQKGVPYPNPINTSHYQSNMIPSPTVMPSFPLNGNVVPPTTRAYNGVPFDLGATIPRYDRTSQPDLGNTFADNVHQFGVDVRTFDAGSKLGPILLEEFEVFCIFHYFPQEIQDMIFECMFPGPRTEHLGLLVHESYGRRQEYRVELPITLFIYQRSRYITFLRYVIIERPKQIQNARKIYGFHVTKMRGAGNITQPRLLCIGPHDTLAISEDIPKWALKQTLEWLQYLDLKIPGGLKSIKHLELRDSHTKSTNFLDDAVALSNVVGFLDFTPLLPSIFTNGILDKISSLQKLTLTNVEKNGKNRHAFNEERVFLWYMIADYLDKTTGLGEKRFVETENIEIKRFKRVQGRKLGSGKQMIYFYYLSTI
ncbi:predicted protein [Sclerotinia sclerotiorum 1980 UF-70]|uniref:Uncharacterized protein n=2 Tax=Sclerotinia sclerotiorum (strain ATCC 18683 / 1980 / Ss-1) TaxID=665079 RepID=A7EU70_SCLS1|nr:predicted protein [Sclerotinia sclerotiorum 1980 UF-70]APA15250.1 hypothetical protein sscle_14g100200 [Sclerotinia sclerotiorum 1980 UF-70]EDN93012.1 predicted protein [Sclerotinia sclerotiorum 1980 UF-70]